MKYLLGLVLSLAASQAFAGTCYIRQFATVQSIGGQTVQVALEPALTNPSNGASLDLSVGTSGTSAASSALDSRTNFIGIFCDTDAVTHFLIGTAPTATTSHFALPSRTMYFTGVSQGLTLKVAFIE